MKSARSTETILILDPVPLPNQIPTTKNQMMGGLGQVPIEAIKAGMSSVLSQCREMFEDASKVLGELELAHVDLSLGIAVDGTVGLFGSHAGAEAKGGIVVRLSR